MKHVKKVCEKKIVLYAKINTTRSVERFVVFSFEQAKRSGNTKMRVCYHMHTY